MWCPCQSILEVHNWTQWTARMWAVCGTCRQCREKSKLPIKRLESRSDKDFDQIRYTGYQKKKLPHHRIRQFALDYMHLVCMGVVKRLLIYLLHGPVNCRLVSQLGEEMPNHMKMLQGAMPTEFARQLWSLHEMDRWATEFCQFLLYTGLVVLRDLGTLSGTLAFYEHFLSLTVCMSILLESDTQNREVIMLPTSWSTLWITVKTCMDQRSLFKMSIVCSICMMYCKMLHTLSVHWMRCHPFHLKITRNLKKVRNSTNPIAQVTKRDPPGFQNRQGGFFLAKHMTAAFSWRMTVTPLCWIRVPMEQISLATIWPLKQLVSIEFVGFFHMFHNVNA